MKGVLRIVTKNFNATLKVAQYGEAQAIIQNQHHSFSPMNILTLSLDRPLLKRLTEELADVESELEEINSRGAIIRKRLKPLHAAKNKVQQQGVEALTDLKETLKERKNAENVIKKLNRTIQKLQEDAEEAEGDLKDALDSIQTHRQTLWKEATPKAMKEQIDSFQKLTYAQLDHKGMKIHHENKTNLLEQIKSEHTEILKKFQEAKEKLAEIVKGELLILWILFDCLD